jgi:hypothetical protein
MGGIETNYRICSTDSSSKGLEGIHREEQEFRISDSELRIEFEEGLETGN